MQAHAPAAVVRARRLARMHSSVLIDSRPFIYAVVCLPQLASLHLHRCGTLHILMITSMSACEEDTSGVTHKQQIYPPLYRVWFYVVS